MSNAIKKTLVLGASENPARYSNLAVKRLRAYGHPVIAVGRRPGKINDVPILVTHPDDTAIDTITLYLNERNQHPFYSFILSLNPKRIIFNPGAENAELEALAAAQGIETMEACTLVLLATSQY